MTQLINNRFETLISLQKTPMENSAQSKGLQLEKGAPESEVNPELKAVADQFEAIFLEMLLKQARDSKLSDGLFDNKADDNFVHLFDQQLAKTSSESVDIGIAEAIINQMAVHRLEK